MIDFAQFCNNFEITKMIIYLSINIMKYMCNTYDDWVTLM